MTFEENTKGKNDNPLVSVITFVYNHGPYLEDYFRGILMQKTDFPFEVIIHDDASTDNSAEIIRKYENEYPHIFRAIYQTENRYSQNVDIKGKFIYPLVRGKYIAYCEGDDYWCSPDKLQRQADYLERHPDCAMCIHPGYVLDHANREISKKRKLTTSALPEMDVHTFDEWLPIMEIAGPTASKMLRIDANRAPEWTSQFSFGDLFASLYPLLHGYYHIDAEPMSVYRINVPTSYNGVRNALPPKDRALAWIDYDVELMRAMELFNQDTNYQYDGAIRAYNKRHIQNIYERMLSVSDNNMTVGHNIKLWLRNIYHFSKKTLEHVFRLLGIAREGESIRNVVYRKFRV